MAHKIFKTVTGRTIKRVSGYINVHDRDKNGKYISAYFIYRGKRYALDFDPFLPIDYRFYENSHLQYLLGKYTDDCYGMIFTEYDDLAERVRIYVDITD